MTRPGLQHCGRVYELLSYCLSTRKDKKERKHVFIESSLLVIPTTLWMKTPGCARTSKHHLQAPSDFGPCLLACCSPCRRWGALASQGHLLLAPSRTLPVGTSPEEWFLAWPPSLDFLPLRTLLCFLPGSSHSYLLLILLPTKGTHFSAAGTQIFIKWTNAFQGPYIYYLMYDLWGNYFKFLLLTMMKKQRRREVNQLS